MPLQEFHNKKVQIQGGISENISEQGVEVMINDTCSILDSCHP